MISSWNLQHIQQLGAQPQHHAKPPTSPIICLCNKPGTQQQPQSSRKPVLSPTNFKKEDLKVNFTTKQSRDLRISTPPMRRNRHLETNSPPRSPTDPDPAPVANTAEAILNHKSRHHPRPPAAGTSGPPGRWPPLGRPAASCCNCARRCGSPRTTGVSTCRRPASPPASAVAGRHRPAQPARDPAPPGAAARAGAAAARRTRAAGPAARWAAPAGARCSYPAGRHRSHGRSPQAGPWHVSTDRATRAPRSHLPRAAWPGPEPWRSAGSMAPSPASDPSPSRARPCRRATSPSRQGRGAAPGRPGARWLRAWRGGRSEGGWPGESSGPSWRRSSGKCCRAGGPTTSRAGRRWPWRARRSCQGWSTGGRPRWASGSASRGRSRRSAGGSSPRARRWPPWAHRRVATITSAAAPTTDTGDIPEGCCRDTWQRDQCGASDERRKPSLDVARERCKWEEATASPPAEASFSLAGRQV